MSLPEVPQPTSALGLVRRGPFARLWWAGVVSSTGDWITIFATFAVAKGIAGDTGIFIALLARIVPGLVFGAVVGVITDRVDRRRLIFIADIGRFVFVPILAFVSDIPGLVAVSLVLEFLGLLSQSPRAAVVPRIVSEENLVTANSLIMGAAYGTIPLGAALGWVLGSLPSIQIGTLIPEANTQFAAAFFADSLTFLVASAIVLTLPRLATASTEERETSALNVKESFGDLRDGAAFLWRNRNVRRVIVGMSAALFGGGTIVVLGLSHVEKVLRADARGFFAIIAFLGLGVAAGVMLVSFYSDRLTRRDVVFAVSLVVTGLGLFAAALTSTVAGTAGWLIVFGTGAGSAYVMGFTHLHEEVTDDLRGRVFAAMFALMRIGLLVSMTVAVPLAAALRNLPRPFDQPTRNVLALGAAVIVITGAAMLWSLRRAFQKPKITEGARAVMTTVQKAGGPFPRRTEQRRNDE